MKAAHVILAVLVAAIWGFAFVATKLGLDSFSPPQLTARIGDGLVLIAGSVDGDVTYLGSSLKKWRNDVMN